MCNFRSDVWFPGNVNKSFVTGNNRGHVVVISVALETTLGSTRRVQLLLLLSGLTVFSVLLVLSH